MNSRYLTGYSLKQEIIDLGSSIDQQTFNLNAYEILSGTSINTLDTHDILIGSSIGNLQTRDNFLQNEIDAIIISGISAGNVDILYGVSISVLGCQ